MLKQTPVEIVCSIWLVIFRARPALTDDLAGCLNEVSIFNKPAFVSFCRLYKIGARPLAHFCRLKELFYFGHSINFKLLA